MNSDMYTIKDAADFLGLNINTFRYKLQKNNNDCNKGIYDTRLYNLMAKVRMVGKIVNKKASRIYERYMILDIEEFKKEFDNYNSFLQENKKRKRKHNLGWSYCAIECYERKMKCSGCIHEDICKRAAKSTSDKIPPMKKVIEKLLIELGLPPKY